MTSPRGRENILKLANSYSRRDVSDLTLEGIELQNFRAYEGRQYFPLAPITLLFGANSAGKTTLFNAIGMLRQSLGQYGSRNSGKFAVRGADVDFGIASEVPNRNNPTGNMAIRLFARPGNVAGPSGKALYPSAALEFMIENQQPRFGVGIRFGLVRPKEGSAFLEVNGYELFLGTDPTPIVTFERSKSKQGIQEEFQLETVNSEHPFWRWYVRQYGVKLLVLSASGDLRTDEIEAENKLIPLDESIRENSELAKFYAKLYSDLCAKNSWTSVKVNEDGEQYEANELQEELSQLNGRMHPSLSDGETPIVREIVRSNPITEEVEKDLISLLARKMKMMDIGIRDSWVPTFVSAPSIMRMRMRMRSVSHPQLLKDPDLGRPGGIDRGLFFGSDIPSLFLQEFLISAAGGLAQVIKNMQTVSARRGEVRRTFILGESERPGELDAASTSRAHLDRMNLALKGAQVPFTYDVRVFTPNTHEIASELKIGAVEVYDAVGRPKNIADVGTGTQYLLPVALAISNESRGLLAIQEPESHLHPNLQSAVATLIAASAARDTQPIVIETHSEAILRRMIDHISGAVEPRIGVGALSVLHVSREGEVSTVRSIRVSDDGRLLDGWPDKARDEGFEV
jgi:predicted ATPase